MHGSQPIFKDFTTLFSHSSFWKFGDSRELFLYTKQHAAALWTNFLYQRTFQITPWSIQYDKIFQTPVVFFLWLIEKKPIYIPTDCVRYAKFNFTIESPKSKQRRVDSIRTICGTDDDNLIIKQVPYYCRAKK